MLAIDSEEVMLGDTVGRIFAQCIVHHLLPGNSKYIRILAAEVFIEGCHGERQRSHLLLGVLDLHVT